jgi:hypothetical protein
MQFPIEISPIPSASDSCHQSALLRFIIPSPNEYGFDPFHLEQSVAIQSCRDEQG